MKILYWVRAWALLLVGRFSFFPEPKIACCGQ